MKEKAVNAIMALYRKIFARPSLFLFNKLLFEMALRGMGVLNFENDTVSGESYLLSNLLRCYDKPLVIDIGANCGNYSQKIMTTAKNSTLYAFEPHPATFSTLQKTAKEYGFEAINCGMGSETGTLQLYDRSLAGNGTEHASLYREVIEVIHNVPSVAVEVAVSTVDEFVAERGVTRINLLKIDTEGHEYQVLIGAKKALKDGIIDVIQIEFNEMNIVSRVFFKDFYNLLGNSFKIYRLLPNGLLPITKYRPLQSELFAFQNLVFVRHDLDIPFAKD